MKYLLNIPEDYKSIINKIIKISAENNRTVYAVGGFVRDMILNRHPNDLDIMVEGENAGIKFAKLLSEKLNIHPPVVFEKFGTAKLVIDGKEIEFIMPRKEYYNDNSRNPDTKIGTLEQDALRRDFTVNAVFLRLNDMKILDLCNKGLEDIKNKIIRVTDEESSDLIFEQDPLRILRAVRQSFQLKFKIERKTYQSMINKAGRITIVSGERIRDEINKMLLFNVPSRAFMMLDDINVLKIIFPELKDTQNQNIGNCAGNPDKDVFHHTMEIIDAVKPVLLLRVAALFRDIGKPSAIKERDGKNSFAGYEQKSAKIAKNILLRLKYPSDFIKQAVFLIENHAYAKMYGAGWKDSCVRRFAKKMSGNLQYMELFNAADAEINNNSLYDRIRRLKKDNMLAPEEDLLNGDELVKALKIPAGKWISAVKKYIEELQFENPNLSKKEALERAKEYIEKTRNILL